MNIALYLRYSSQNQTEASIEGQRDVCQEYARVKKYNIVFIISPQKLFLL